MTLISEVVGQKGAYSILKKVNDKADVLPESEIEQLIQETSISQESFAKLIEKGIVITTSRGYYISSLGKKVCLLLSGINGDYDNLELYNRLTHLSPDFKPYDLITENITDYFINSLENHCDFIRIYICSPWIRLDETHLRRIQGAVQRASRVYKNLEIFVITKPKENYNNWKASIDTFKVLKSMGAQIVTNTKLHSKIYISEPGSFGGSHYAILGSENLTGKRNIEIAIRIEYDNDILKKLNQYFYEITQESEILKEE